MAQQGGNGLKLYDPADELAAAANRGDLLAIIQQALEKNSFRLLFQPIISLRGDTHEHYEVLLRLFNPQGEELSTLDVLNDAKAAGLAERIDRWVLLNSIRLLAEHRSIERPRNGLGDLTGAVFLARLLSGVPAGKALQSTTASVFEILARTAKRGADELTLETDAQSLSHPMAMVHLRHLTHPGRDRRA